MVVKEKQPQCLEDMETVLALPPVAGERRPAAAPLALGQGGIAQRRMQTRNVLMGDRDWPGRAQVFRRERHVIIKKTGEGREEGGTGITRLAPERADAGRLLALVRGQ